MNTSTLMPAKPDLTDDAKLALGSFYLGLRDYVYDKGQGLPTAFVNNCVDGLTSEIYFLTRAKD